MLCHAGGLSWHTCRNDEGRGWRHESVSSCLSTVGCQTWTRSPSPPLVQFAALQASVRLGSVEASLILKNWNPAEATECSCARELGVGEADSSPSCVNGETDCECWEDSAGQMRMQERMCAAMKYQENDPITEQPKAQAVTSRTSLKELKQAAEKYQYGRTAHFLEVQTFTVKRKSAKVPVDSQQMSPLLSYLTFLC